LAAGQSISSDESGAGSAPRNASELLKEVDLLVQQNAELEKHNKALMTEISSLRQALAMQLDDTSVKVSAVKEEEIPSSSIASEEAPAEGVVSTPPARASAAQEEKATWSPYTPNQGFKFANTEYGDASLSVYTYARYLNQRALEPTYTNAFGVTSTLQQRQDFQLNKVQFKFLGWMMSPKFRYFLYSWSSNASQGLGAQVVLAGNLSYNFAKAFTVGAGIFSLPGTRSVEGNFPFWLAVDSRHIADEFFRPSYSSGVRVSGALGKTMTYQVMVANNLSTLGVSAAQLDNDFNTLASAFVWMPTTGEFGAGFGDFEGHEKVATRFAAHFSHSHETRQEQPNSDTFENTQIRLSDGSVVFTPNLFGPNTLVNDVDYTMSALDFGVKYRGYALEGEYFMRWLNHWQGPGTEIIPTDFSNGYQIQSSAMVIPKTLQVYLGGSEIMGHYGRPWDLRTGVNYFPFKNRVIRWNSEFLYTNRSPVGYTSVPFALGGTGPIFATTLEMAY
jgi:hypothetical protein